jgi:GNAT superfamily N-acetyltransferase
MNNLLHSNIQIRAPQPGDMSYIVHAQARFYAQEYGWDWTFEALACRIAADFIENFKPGRERGWIAVMDGSIVGSVFAVEDTAETAKLRMLYVDKAARGHGLGGRLVDECIAFARAAGYRTLVLWTNDNLVSARKIYQARGFQLIAEEPHHSFGVDLVGQTWSLDL